MITRRQLFGLAGIPFILLKPIAPKGVVNLKDNSIPEIFYSTWENEKLPIQMYRTNCKTHLKIVENVYKKSRKYYCIGSCDEYATIYDLRVNGSDLYGVFISNGHRRISVAKGYKMQKWTGWVLDHYEYLGMNGVTRTITIRKEIIIAWKS